jgi:hypothetical protein
LVSFKEGMERTIEWYRSTSPDMAPRLKLDAPVG